MLPGFLFEIVMEVSHVAIDAAEGLFLGDDGLLTSIIELDDDLTGLVRLAFDFEHREGFVFSRRIGRAKALTFIALAGRGGGLLFNSDNIFWPDVGGGNRIQSQNEVKRSDVSDNDAARTDT